MHTLNYTADIRLTDALERKLLEQAIEDQGRLHPLRALLAISAKLRAYLDSRAQAAMLARAVTERYSQM